MPAARRRTADRTPAGMAQELKRLDTVRGLRLGLLVAGAVLLTVLVVRIGWDPILAVLTRLGWWQLALICLPYALVMVVDTLGWRYAFARSQAPFRRLLGARIAGEALNAVTALGSVGGEAVKAWLVRRDVSYRESVPSLIIAKTTITIAQALFLVIGIGLAWAGLVIAVDAPILTAMLWLLVVEALAVAGFLLAQILGVVAHTGRLLVWAGVVESAESARSLDRALRTYYGEHWRRLALSVGFHLAGWLLGVVETVLILALLAMPASLGTATVIEALGSGVRFATFLVPASLGVFEGANAAAFAALGLGAEAGLAYSLVRRARQAVWIGAGIVLLLVMRRGDP